MYIEDLILSLAIGRIRLNIWDQKVVSSFYNQITIGSGFTEKQGTLALRIIKRYQPHLEALHTLDLTSLIENPQYRLVMRKSVSSRRVNIVDSDTAYDRLIEVRFPYNESVINEIRKFKNDNPTSHIVWDKDKSAWIFSLSEEHIMFLMNIFKDDEVEYDEEFAGYVDQIQKIVSNMENYVPMLVLDGENTKIVNSGKFMPEITGSNLVESLFKARQLGINMWCQDIDTSLNNGLVDDTTKNFLKSELHKIARLKTEKNDIFCLKNILTYLGPTLFIIPGVNELAKLQQMCEILNEMNIDHKDISVLFRLSSESGKNFNDFVKNSGLNNPVTENTKMVFVSGKLPKPLIKSNLEFNSIVNLGFSNAHYTLRDFVKNHENMVFFDVEKSQQGFDFADM
jgi:hypothetical protein